VKRRLFNLAAVLSLLLCIATLALWVRSYCRLDTAYYIFDSPPSLLFLSLRGRVEVVLFRAPGPDSSYPLGFWHESDAERDFVLFAEHRAVFGFALVTSGESAVVSVPHWFLAPLFAILPALHLRSTLRSRRRNRAGHCPRCGYDLRATPERCPECGAVPAVK
jgi:hypothetical protein